MEEILEEELSRHFWPPHIREYMETTNPEDHLCRLENVFLLHQYSDSIKCQIFLTTLAGPSQYWFSRLKSKSINSFENFNALLQHHFTTVSATIRPPPPPSASFNVVRSKDLTRIYPMLQPSYLGSVNCYLKYVGKCFLTGIVRE